MANDFLVFGGGAGANVVTQSAWAALGARTAGFSSGVAQSAQLNKAWRQSSIMAAVLGQFITDRTGQDVLDDGTTATILANLKLSAAAVNGDGAKTFSVAASAASGHAVNQSQVLGVGQSFTDVKASRAFGTTYTNSTGKPIVVYASATTTAANGAMSGIVNGAFCSFSVQLVSGTVVSANFVVPAGATYSVSVGTATIQNWYELR